MQPAPFREPGQGGHRGARPPVTLIEGVPTYAYPNGAVPGPRPPKSWSSLFGGEEEGNPVWRTEALRVLFEALDALSWASQPDGRRSVLPLALMCAQVLLQEYKDPEELAAVAVYIPAHIRKDLVRWCAAQKPLISNRLYALCGDEGHMDGELIIVGPQAHLRGNVLKKNLQSSHHSATNVDSGGEGNGGVGGGNPVDETWDDIKDWDDTPSDSPPPLSTLALVATPLPSSLLFSLPPTLTYLALLALPQHTPIHRLPRLCPLLEVLDLSFNKWLSGSGEYGAGSPEGTIDRVEWRRWGHLRVLGLRECGGRAWSRFH